MKQYLNRLLLNRLLEFLPLISKPGILVESGILKESEVIDFITYPLFFRLRFLILIFYNIPLLFIKSESELELYRKKLLLLLLSNSEIRLYALLSSSFEKPF